MPQSAQTASPCRIAWTAACVLGFLAVMFGAFGAHALKNEVTPERLAVFETGVRYQMYHAIVLLCVSFLPASLHSRFFRPSVVFFFAGTVIFSGSLYILVLSGVRAWGAVTPIGGLLLLAGWLGLACSLVSSKKAAA